MGSRTAGVAALLSSLALCGLASLSLGGLGMLVTASVAAAQTVPMPVPAPQPKSYGPPAAPRPPAAVAPAAKPPEQASGFPSIFSKPPALFGKIGRAHV